MIISSVFSQDEFVLESLAEATRAKPPVSHNNAKLQHPPPNPRTIERFWRLLYSNATSNFFVKGKVNDSNFLHINWTFKPGICKHFLLANRSREGTNQLKRWHVNSGRKTRHFWFKFPIQARQASYFQTQSTKRGLGGGGGWGVITCFYKTVFFKSFCKADVHCFSRHWWRVCLLDEQCL